MLALVEDQLVADSGRLQPVVEGLDLVGLDVVVVEAVDHYHRALDPLDLRPVVAPRPEGVVVAALPVLGGGDRLQVGGVVVLDLQEVGQVGGPTEGFGRQHVGVLALEAARGHHQAVFTVVVVPAGDRRLADDRCQAGHPGGGDRRGQGAEVGAAGHRYLAVAPAGADRLAAGSGGKGPPVAVEPLDDRFHRGNLLRRAAGLEAVAILGANPGGVDDRVAAGGQVVVEGVGWRFAEGLAGLRGLTTYRVVVLGGRQDRFGRGRSGCPLVDDWVVDRVSQPLAPGVVGPLVVGAGGEDGRHPQAGGAIGRADDLDLD